MGLFFIKTSPVKQYSYENDFNGVFDALHPSFLVAVVFRDHSCFEVAVLYIHSGVCHKLPKQSIDINI